MYEAVCSSYHMGRAHRSHRWGHWFESSTDHSLPEMGGHFLCAESYGKVIRPVVSSEKPMQIKASSRFKRILFPPGKVAGKLNQAQYGTYFIYRGAANGSTRLPQVHGLPILDMHIPFFWQPLHISSPLTPGSIYITRG